MIRTCTKCSNKPHEQDNIHGKGRRVINENRHKSSVSYVCTVCGDTVVQTFAPSKKDKEGEK